MLRLNYVALSGFLRRNMLFGLLMNYLGSRLLQGRMTRSLLFEFLYRFGSIEFMFLLFESIAPQVAHNAHIFNHLQCALSSLIINSELGPLLGCRSVGQVL